MLRNYWSDYGEVFFCDGKGYGLTDTLQTICLGTADDIKKFFETGELNNELNPTRRRVLNGILDYRKEQGIGTTDTGTADMKRQAMMELLGVNRKQLDYLRLEKASPASASDKG